MNLVYMAQLAMSPSVYRTSQVQFLSDTQIFLCPVLVTPCTSSHHFSYHKSFEIRV